MESKAFLQCPRCGTENSRASQTCIRCAYELHGRAEVVGVCPHCRAPIRSTQITCFSCGKHLAANVAPDRVLLSPRERRRLRRERSVAKKSAQLVGQSLANLPAWLRVLGAICTVGGAVRGYMAGTALRQSQGTPILGMHFTGEMTVWVVVMFFGFLLLALSVVVQRD